MPLLPAIAATVAAGVAAGRRPVSAGTPEEARRQLTEMRPVLGRGPDLPCAETLTVPTRAGSIPARLFAAGDRPLGVVVYFHGGGWVLGTPEDFEAVARVLAARSGCAVVLPDYRLAPEAPFPAAVEDALDAVTWAASFGRFGAGLPLVVAGDSAGGNLAAVAAAELHGVLPIAAQVLIYPVTDGDLDTESYRTLGRPGLLSRADMAWFFDLYAPGAARTDPLLHPAARPSLAGLPPAHVVTAEVDVLRDEGEAYARRLRDAGVPTTLHRAAGLPHGFVRLHNLFPAADAALGAVAEAIASACRGAPNRTSEGAPA